MFLPILKTRSTTRIIFVSFLLFSPCVLSAAVEGTYSEKDIEMERDQAGVVLNANKDVHRDIPDDRKMKSIVSNVVKAEERDEYIRRSLVEIRTEMEKRDNELDVKIAKLQGQVIAIKELLMKSGAFSKNKLDPKKPAAAENTETTSKTEKSQEVATTIV